MAKEPFAAKLTSIWIGGFFFWFVNGFKTKLSEQFTTELEKKNLWAGYFIQLLFVGILVYILTKNEISI
ncbi:hypothetical protein [Flavobacterium sp. N2038]|uniref:hypothetical protein n=1 Tax=Flavobacterium sp. N2038 TaxID=2986829 RepID=UPI002224FB03|nr:hypothetical protein [Flavobacterium sp. N2038]